MFGGYTKMPACMLSIETPGRSASAAIARLRARLEPAPAAGVSAVGGRRDGQGWKVQLLGHDGAGQLAELTTEAARALAAEILSTCDVLEGKVW